MASPSALSPHGSRYSRSSPYASEEPLSHSMTSLSSDAVRCDVIRTSVGASDVSPHGDVVSCSISSTNRRRSTPWQYLGPAMKRRKAMLPLQEAAITPSSADGLEIQHGFVFNPVRVGEPAVMYSTATPSSSASRQRWNFAAASSAASGSSGPDPYPTAGDSTPPASSRTPFGAGGKRYGASFRKSGGSNGNQSKSSVSGSTAVGNQRGSVRWSSFRKSDTNESETANASNRKSSRRSGPSLFRSLFGRQSERKSGQSSSGSGDLWVEVPLWTPASLAAAEAADGRIQLLDNHGQGQSSSNRSGTTADAHRKDAAMDGGIADAVETPIVTVDKSLPMVTSSGRRTDACIDNSRPFHQPIGGEIPVKSVPSVRGCGAKPSAPRVSCVSGFGPTTGRSVVTVSWDLGETRNGCVDNGLRPPPGPTATFCVAVDDPMELDLTAFDAVIASLQKATGEYTASASSDDTRRMMLTAADLSIPSSATSSDEQKSADGCSNSDNVNVNASHRATEAVPPRKKPALFPKPPLSRKLQLPRVTSISSHDEPRVAEADSTTSPPTTTTTATTTTSARHQTTVTASDDNMDLTPQADGELVTSTTAMTTTTTISDWVDSLHKTKRSTRPATRSFMETDIDAVDNCLVIGDDSRQSVSCNNAVAIVMTSVSDCSVVSLSNGDVDGCCCSSSMELHHEDAEVGQPPKVTEPRIPDDEPAPNPPPPMTTEQWLDSLHRRKKFRSSATVGLSDADRSRLFAHGGVQSPADGSVRLPTPVDATSWHQMAGVCGHGDLQPETGDWIAINMNDSTSQSSISLATTTGTTSPDADRLSVERRRGGTAATPKPTSFFSRFRRAMVSGFGSLLGINTADDNHSTKSKTPTADFAAAAIAAPYSVATIGRGGNQQQPRNGTNSVIARLTADGIINSEEYDRMTELEKLAVLAEKMALDKQKALVTAACTTSSSCHQQSLVEHGSAPPSSFDIHANSASAFDSVDDSFGSLRRVPRSKSCHSMGTGNRLSVASSKFPMTPTSPVEFDDIVTRFASVKLARDDAPSATSLQSNSNSIIDSLTPATPDGGSVDSCLRQKPAGESEEDSRRISTTSSLSSSSCSSGYGSLRRAKPSAVPRGSQRLSTAGVSASAHAISCNLASHSLADVDRLSTSPLGPVGENSAMPPVVESRVTHGDRTAKCSAKEVEHERRRAMPSDNSFTSYDTTSKASRALAVQFHKAQQRRAQSLIVDSADDRVPAHSDQRKVDEPAPPAADETGRIQRGRRPKTPPKPPPSRIRARTSCVVPAGNGSPAHPVVCSTDGNEGLEGLSQRPWSLQEISAIIEKELKANENIQQTIEGIDGGRIREQLQSSVARSTSGRPTAVIGSTPRERSFAKRLETNSGRIGGKSHGIETTFDDDDLGVDVNDDDEDATSTSTLTDETITQSTSTINRRSESSSSTTLEISSDDFDRLFPSQRQLELTMLRSNCDSVSSSGGEQSSFEFTQMQRKNLTLRPTPPSNGLHFQSSSSAIFDEFCVAFGGSLPASCRRAATGATNDRLLSPRASSSLTVGVSTCRGSDVTEADCNGDDEAGQHSNRRLVRPTKLALDETRQPVGKFAFDRRLTSDPTSKNAAAVDIPSQISPSFSLPVSMATRSAACRGGSAPGCGVERRTTVVVGGQPSLDAVVNGLLQLASSPYHSNSSGIASWCDSASSPRSHPDSPV